MPGHQTNLTWQNGAVTPAGGHSAATPAGSKAPAHDFAESLHDHAENDINDRADCMLASIKKTADADDDDDDDDDDDYDGVDDDDRDYDDDDDSLR